MYGKYILLFGCKMSWNIKASFIDFYGKCGKLEICEQIFDEIKNKICNATINYYGRNGEASEVFKYIMDILRIRTL